MKNMPLILYRKEDDTVYTNMLFMDSDMTFYYDKNNKLHTAVKLQDIPDEDYEQLVDSFGYQHDPKVLYDDDGQGYCLTKIQYGDTAGYRPTELTYAGDLIANVGESITSVLDKIKNMLVEFEYFYDVEGRFVFQKKQSFTSTLWSPTEDGTEEIQSGLLWSGAAAYTFSGGELVTAFNNNPNLSNLKNDFSIWGERTGISGANIPIHLRYAIDVKPKTYTTICLTDFDKEEVKEYNDKYGTTLSDNPISITYSVEPNYMKRPNYVYVTDWREILFQMAKDYFKYNTLSDFEIRLREANPLTYPTGRTGYEQYYTDIQVCWRQLYNPELRNKISALKESIELIEEELPKIDKQIISLENDIIKINNDLNVATTVNEVNNLSVSLLSKQQERTQKKNDKAQKEYLLEQYKEDLEKNQENITNYYQAEELSKDPSQACYTMQVSLMDDLIKVKDNQYFLIPLSCIDRIYNENGEPAPLVVGNIIYSINDDSYFKILSLKEDVLTVQYLEDIRLHWNKDVFLNPGVLNYWFDFLDTEGELNQFSVRAVGARTKAINENTVKSIYFRETPQVVFVDSINDSDKMHGYKYIQIKDLDKMFTISAQGKSAKERLDELLYAHGYCSESATVTTIPIYYLQPNTRVYISDPETKLGGDYIVSKITIPLSHNGTMQLTTTKAAQTIFF